MKINKAIENLKNNIIIVISHKINNLKNADKIIFMKNGKVEEQDSWDNLIKLKKSFYNFVKQYEVKSCNGNYIKKLLQNFRICFKNYKFIKFDENLMMMKSNFVAS